MAMDILLPWWIVRRDQRRLPEHELARTWTEASFWAAIVTFGAFSIPVHFTKARRSLAGFAAGVGWMLAVIAARICAGWLFSRAPGIP
jgi:hypothetical protein